MRFPALQHSGLVFISVMAASACTRQEARPAARPAARAAPVPNMAPAADPALSADTAAALATTFQRSGMLAALRGDTVHAASHFIRVRVGVVHVADQNDTTVAAIDVALDVDGEARDAFHVQSVAFDRDRNGALQHAIRQWSVAYAIPITEALKASGGWGGDNASGDASATSSPIAMGPYRVFAGPTGMRGEDRENADFSAADLHDAFLRQVNAALGEIIPVARQPGFHSLKITLHVRAASGGEGECRVDGVQSDRLCQIARAFRWPATPEEYLFKQFYVLAPR